MAVPVQRHWRLALADDRESGTQYDRFLLSRAAPHKRCNIDPYESTQTDRPRSGQWAASGE